MSTTYTITTARDLGKAVRGESVEQVCDVLGAVETLIMVDGGAAEYRVGACGYRAWAWRWAALDLPDLAIKDARRASIYDEIADAKARNDHDAVMVGFARLSEVTRG